MKKGWVWILSAVALAVFLEPSAFARYGQDKKYDQKYEKKYGHGYHSKKRGKGHGGSDENSRRNKKAAEIQREEETAADAALANGVDPNENE